MQINSGAAFGDGANEYLTDYPKQITYSSKNYRPFPIVHEDIPETAKPEQTTFIITVANIDLAIATYLESGKILGNQVKITWVFLKAETEEVVLAFDDTYDILSAELDDTQARVSFEVGQVNLFQIQLPKNRWQDSRCEWVYKSIGYCDYGRDEFEGVSKLRINTALANGKDLTHGWKIMNASNADLMDIDNTYPSELLIRVPINKDTRWNVSTRTGPFVYRKFLAADFVNFEVEINLTGIGNEDQESVGMLFCTDSDVTQDWVYICHRFASGNERVQFHSMDDNVYAVINDVVDSTNKFLKIKKTGALFEFFKKATEAASYGAATASVSRADLNNIDLRAGLTAETYSSTRASAFEARIGYWRLLSGGKASCDRVLSGVNGCRQHDNTKRYGAAPGILHGPLIL